MATKKTIIALLTTLEEIYTHRDKLSDETIQIYCDLFSDIPDELIAAATKQHIAQAKFFPSPAELLEICRMIANWDGKAPPAILAWGEVQDKLTNYRCEDGKRLSSQKGKNENERMKNIFAFIEHRNNCEICQGKATPEFTHPLIRETVDAIGWEYLRYSENLIADRAHFLKAYESLTLRQKENEIVLPEIKQLAERKSIKKLTS